MHLERIAKEILYPPFSWRHGIHRHEQVRANSKHEMTSSTTVTAITTSGTELEHAENARHPQCCHELSSASTQACDYVRGLSAKRFLSAATHAHGMSTLSIAMSPRSTTYESAPRPGHTMPKRWARRTGHFLRQATGSKARPSHAPACR